MSVKEMDHATLEKPVCQVKSERMTAGRYIAEFFKAHDISHVFYMDAVLRSALVEMDEIGVHYVLAHSEKAAVYMTDGYARAGRRPGVCMAQSVGAANLAAGLQDPCFAQTPIVAITGRHVQKNQYRNYYQELPHEPMFSAFVKFSGRAEEAEELPHVLRTALRTAMGGNGGPTHVDVAGHTGDVLGLKEADFAIVPEARLTRIPAYRPGATPQELAALAEAFNRAERPVIVLGLGAVHSNAGAALTAFAEKASAAVVSSLDGKNVIFEKHPLAAGIAGTYSCQSANLIMAEADLVVFAGSEAGDQVTNNFSLVSKSAVVAQIDVDPAELGRNFPGALCLQSDVARCFEELLPRIEERKREAWRARIAETVEAWRELIEPAKASSASPIRPERLCREIEQVLPADAILVADTGFSSHWSGTLIDMTSPDQRYLRAAGSLGWAFPAALGAKASRPDLPVVCFTGDGGFAYHLPELETARRHGLATITIVNNNRGLAQGMRNISTIFAGRGCEARAFEYVEADFAAVARAYGCFGVRIEDPADFAAAFAEAAASGLPAVIEVITERDAQPEPAWSPAG